MKFWHTLAIVFAGLAVVFGVVVVVQARMLLARDWTVPLGNVAEWFGAVSGVATASALVFAWRSYRHEVTTRRDEQRERAVGELAEFMLLCGGQQSGLSGRELRANHLGRRTRSDPPALSTSPGSRLRI